MTIFYRSSPFEGTRFRDVQGHHMHEKEESLMPQDLRFEFLVEDMFRFLVWPGGTRRQSRGAGDAGSRKGRRRGKGIYHTTSMRGLDFF
jgi:hypothetical protein